MYKGKEVIAVVPARGGSKGIPGKNMVDLVGHPLIYWTIARAQRSSYIDRVIVSSDDNKILDYALSVGVEAIKRPDEFATDTASSVGVLIHTLEEIGSQYTDSLIVFLQPTSPLRTTSSIDDSIEFTLDQNYNYVMSVSPISKSPYHIYREEKENRLVPLFNPENIKDIRRQSLPEAYVSNGAIYLVQARFFYKIRSFKPDEIHAYKMETTENIDIDTFEDLEEARKIIKKENLKP